MLKDSENLKDTGTSLAIRNEPSIITYTKTNKLISALFMVTDMIDKDEPLRGKLRDLGTGIVSDVNENPVRALSKIADILSFLDIASAVQMISSMNATILKKEFTGLKQSIKEFINQGDPLWLEQFMLRPAENSSDQNKVQNSRDAYQGHSTRIGVQKGSTLMKALSKVEVSDRAGDSFDILKQQRRDEIIKIIQDDKQTKGTGMTITDIRSGAKNIGDKSMLASCSDKTLQRELISMLKDNVLNKTGEKRWSKYFLPK